MIALMGSDEECVLVRLPPDLLRFAVACAGQADISAVVTEALKLLAEQLGALCDTGASSSSEDARDASCSPLTSPRCQ